MEIPSKYGTHHPDPDQAEQILDAEISLAYGPGLGIEPIPEDESDIENDSQLTSMHRYDKDVGAYEKSFKTPILDTSKFGRAACIGSNPDIFFPSKGGDHRKAKAICADCPPSVTEACALNGEQSDAYGVWGGISGNQRKKKIARDDN